MWKTEVAIKMYLRNNCSYYFLWIKRSYLQFQENAWKIFLNKFTFNAVTFQVFFQGFYLDFKILNFRFPRACIFQNTFFHPFMVAGLGMRQQLTRWETVLLLILFKVLGCLRSSIKIWSTLSLSIYIVEHKTYIVASYICIMQ